MKSQQLGLGVFRYLPDISPIEEIKRCKKRAIVMGNYHKYNPNWEKIKPSPYIHNTIDLIIQPSWDHKTDDYATVLRAIHSIAVVLNDYCDNNKVVGNTFAEYHLELFLWYVDIVCDISKLEN